MLHRSVRKNRAVFFFVRIDETIFGSAKSVPLHFDTMVNEGRALFITDRFHRSDWVSSVCLQELSDIQKEKMSENGIEKNG